MLSEPTRWPPWALGHTKDTIAEHCALYEVLLPFMSIRMTNSDEITHVQRQVRGTMRIIRYADDTQDGGSTMQSSTYSA